jgi:hypothetical protein
MGYIDFESVVSPSSLANSIGSIVGPSSFDQALGRIRMVALAAEEESAMEVLLVEVKELQMEGVHAEALVVSTVEV